ncbi:hypothetical protein OAG64_01060 [Akkermansiaceae bacterium]|nr:hypothetical protein [Akkermansiaceae bacterium]
MQGNLERVLNLRDHRIQKADESFVTKGDLLVQDVVYDFLAKEHPQYRLVSEEMDNSSYDTERDGNFAVLDPVDGTENFTSGLPEWGVGVSVFTEWRHDYSMILLPELGRSLMTGERVRMFESRIHGVSSSLKLDDLSFVESGFEYRMMGCSMYNLYNVVRGSYAMFENVKGVNCWDILPGLNLALEHGLEVEVNGNKYNGEFLPPIEKYRIKVRVR